MEKSPRLFTDKEVELLKAIKILLKDHYFTIRGAQIELYKAGLVDTPDFEYSRKLQEYLKRWREKRKATISDLSKETNHSQSGMQI